MLPSAKGLGIHVLSVAIGVRIRVGVPSLRGLALKAKTPAGREAVRGYGADGLEQPSSPLLPSSTGRTAPFQGVKQGFESPWEYHELPIANESMPP